MVLDEAIWAEIRQAYETEPEPVGRLASRYEISASSIYRRAKSGGWKRLQSSTAVARGRRNCEAANQDGRCSAPETRTIRPASRIPKQTVVSRLYRAIDNKLKQLEARMGSGREVSVAESERETRELGAMIRSFEKVTEFATEIENRRKTAAPERTGAADAERMRAEIAERLERINAQGNGCPRSGAAE